MSEGVRVIGPDRAQLRWDMVDLDSQLPEDHRALRRENAALLVAC